MLSTKALNIKLHGISHLVKTKLQFPKFRNYFFNLVAAKNKKYSRKVLGQGLGILTFQKITD